MDICDDKMTEQKDVNAKPASPKTEKKEKEAETTTSQMDIRDDKVEEQKEDEKVVVLTPRLLRNFNNPPEWFDDYCAVHQKMKCFTNTTSSSSDCVRMTMDEKKVPHAYSSFLCAGYSTIVGGGKGLFLDVGAWKEWLKSNGSRITTRTRTIPKATTIAETTYRSSDVVVLLDSALFLFTYSGSLLVFHCDRSGFSLTVSFYR
jgi:hypothetical protein